MTLDYQHIVLYGALALALIGGTYLYEAKRAEVAEGRAVAAESKAADSEAQNKLFQQNVQVQLSQLAAQNAQLSAALAQRQVLEVKVPQQNASLTAAQVAAGIDSTTGNKVGTTVAQGDSLILPTTLGKDALSALQLVPLLQADKVALTTENTNLSKSLDLEKQAHVSDVTALNLQITADKLEIKAVKAQARKSKFRWLGAGIIIGYGLRLATGKVV